MFLILFSVIFIINIVAFGLYALDKRYAVYNLRRIPETVLLGLAIVGGAYGAGTAMLLFRHKTRHVAFCIIVPICCLILIAALVAICWFAMPTQAPTSLTI